MEKAFTNEEVERIWSDSEYSKEKYVCDYPSESLISSIEDELGYKIPSSYIELMQFQNGGLVKRHAFPTKESTSWAKDHVAIAGIKGIGRDKVYSLCGELGSYFKVEEWEYPDIGIYFGDCPSAGHDMICLDYRNCGPKGEPEVVHVDQESNYKITFLAKNFEGFIKGLVDDSVFDEE